MGYMWTIFGLYIIYYLVLPLSLVFVLWKIWQKNDEVKGLVEFGSKKKSGLEMKKKVGEMKKLQVYFVIVLLLFIPLTNVVSSQIQELSIEYDREPAGTFGADEYPQLRRQLGPSYDTDSVIAEMETYLFSLDLEDYELETGYVSDDLIEEFEDRDYNLEEGWSITHEDGIWWILSDEEEKKYRIEETESRYEIYERPPLWRNWFIEEVREEVDLDRLTRLPGRLAVYFLEKRSPRERFLVVTYNYLSPLPITRTFAFSVFENEAFFVEEDIIIYPEDPSNIDPL